MRICVSSAVAVTLIAGGCGDSGPARQTAPSPPPASREAPVVSVEGDFGTRRITVTGVVLEASQGLVITADHAVEDARAIDVTVSSGSVVHARVLARAQCHDLAVLELVPTPLRLRGLPLGDSRSADVGEPVTTLTYTHAPTRGKRSAMSRIRGTIAAAGVRVAFAPLPSAGPFIAHATPLAATASGSPIVDARGRMLGINTLVGRRGRRGVAGVEYALSANYIRARLRQLRPGAAGALTGWANERDTCGSALRRLARA